MSEKQKKTNITEESTEKVPKSSKTTVKNKTKKKPSKMVKSSVKKKATPKKKNVPKAKEKPYVKTAAEKARDRRLANLKLWEKGKSANPKGKPKGTLNFNTRMNLALERFTDEFVEQHNSKYKQKARHITKEDVDIEGDIFMKFVSTARSGDMKAIKEFMEMRYGKAAQTHRHGGIDNDAIKFEEMKRESKSKAKAFMKKWTGVEVAETPDEEDDNK